MCQLVCVNNKILLIWFSCHNKLDPFWYTCFYLICLLNFDTNATLANSSKYTLPFSRNSHDSTIIYYCKGESVNTHFVHILSYTYCAPKLCLLSFLTSQQQWARYTSRNKCICLDLNGMSNILCHGQYVRCLKFY